MKTMSKSLIQSVFGKKSRRRSTRRRLAMLESLENRQLLTAVIETGVNDQQISEIGQFSGDTGARVRNHASAYNAINDEYLVVWAADGR